MFKVNYNYEKDILSRKFEKITELIRNGDISVLNNKERNLLADHLEGKLKRPKGRPKDSDELLMAEHCFVEFTRFRREGLNRADALRRVADPCGTNIDTSRVEQHLATYRPYAEQQWHDDYLCNLSCNHSHNIFTDYQNQCIEGSTHEEAVHFIAVSYQVEHQDAEELVKCAQADSNKISPEKA